MHNKDWYLKLKTEEIIFLSSMGQSLLQQTPMLGAKVCYNGSSSQSWEELPFREKVPLMEEAQSGGKTPPMMML